MSDTTGWKRGSEFADYEKTINRRRYEIVRFAPHSSLWWIYVGGVTLGIIPNLADAKRAAHRHAEGKG